MDEGPTTPRTYEWYRELLERFSTFLKSDRNALRLKPVDVLRWTAKHPQWSGMHQRTCIKSIQRAYRWAHRVGIIDRNPIQFIDKPPATRREQIVTPEEYPGVLAEINSAQFKELVMTAWETGARPQELTRL
jgi:integrase